MNKEPWIKVGEHEEERILTPKEAEEIKKIDSMFRCDVCKKEKVRMRGGGGGMRCWDSSCKNYLK